ALSLAGPHALLSLLSIAAALDPDSIPGDGGRWLHRSVASEAWRILAAVAAHAVPATATLNPIDLLDTMTTGDGIALCPLVFGYVNYSSVELAQPLTFTNAPAAAPGGPPGSIIGGTGIALSRRCR